MKPKSKESNGQIMVLDDAKKIQRYIGFHGMFEKFKDQKYAPHDTSINKDLNEWRVYDNNQTLNDHGLMEMQINLSDAVFKGSEENINEVDQVLSTYQLRVNRTNYEADAYLTCANNTFSKCQDHLYSSGKVVSLMKSWILRG